MKRNTGLIISALIVVLILSPGIMSAQHSDSSQRAALLNTALENLHALRQYSWNMKAGMSAKDKNQAQRLFQLKWGKDGKLLLTEKADASVVADNEENKMVAAVAEMVVKYMGPPDNKLDSFYQAAQLNPDTGGLIELNGGDFMIPDDKVTIDADKIIFIIRRITFTTMYEDDDLMGTIEYAVDNSGFKYPAKVKVDIPARRATILFENIDFVKQN